MSRKRRAFRPGSAKHLRFANSSYARRLQAERLEDRRLLATVTVGNALDVTNAPDTSTIAALIADDGGDGISLREAIAATNAEIGSDTILFDATLAGQTITLSGTELDVSNALTIDASDLDSRITIDANGQSRVLHFTSALGDLSLLNLSVANGRTTDDNQQGAGIRFGSSGTLTLSNSLVSGNVTTGQGSYGGGIFSTGQYLTLENTVVTQNRADGDGASGGGIAAILSTLSVNHSVVSDNASDRDGGGVYLRNGEVTLVSSTLSGNRSGRRGGGLYSDSSLTSVVNSTVSYNNSGNDGGGISTQLGDLTISSSTISTNQSGDDGGGIFSIASLVNITSSTIVLNNAVGVGGGLLASDSDTNPGLLIENTIIASNSDVGVASDLRPDPGAGIDFSFSLLGNTTGSGINDSIGAGNILNADPMLGPLVSFGGPTATHPLLPGSPAIDAGNSLEANDQRGSEFARTADLPEVRNDANGNASDIGAYEVQPSFATGETLVVDTLADELDGDFSLGDLSLREAIAQLNSNGNAAGFLQDRITFNPALSGGTISLTLGELEATESLSLDASGLASGLTIDAGRTSRVLNISAQFGDFEITNLTLTGGLITADGDDRFLDSRGFSDSAGGGLQSLTSGSLEVRDSLITGNATTGNSGFGGGVSAVGLLQIENSTIANNSTLGAYASGGGISSGPGGLLITNSTIDRNLTGGISESDQGAVGGGVALFVSSLGPATISRSTISGNRSSGNGGGVYASGYSGTSQLQTLSISSSTISGNQSDTTGGGVAAQTPNLAIRDSTIVFNSASTAGGIEVFGASDVEDSAPVIRSTIVAENQAATNPDVQVNGMVSLRHNLVGNPSGSGLGDTMGEQDGNGNITGVTNLLIGALADNGGPTKTHALFPGSPAINRGGSLAFSSGEFDQRGEPFVRAFASDDALAEVQASFSSDEPLGFDFFLNDIGAFELQPRISISPQVLVVDTLEDESDGDFSSGDLSLREAIELLDANNNTTQVDTIFFDSSLDGGSIVLTMGELTSSESLRIDALSLPSGITVNADGQSRVFNALGNLQDFELGGLRVTGGVTTGGNDPLSFTGLNNGGGIRHYSYGTLRLEDAIIAGNRTEGSNAQGGGIWAGRIESTGSLIENNSTLGGQSRGGGIASFAFIDLHRTTISGNLTAGIEASGGGFYLSPFSYAESSQITESTISGNRTLGPQSPGGGIHASGFFPPGEERSIIIRDSTISSNTTAGQDSVGGGVSIDGPILELVNSTVSGNQTSLPGAHGAGIHSESEVIIQSSTITNNEVAGNASGGGAYLAGLATITSTIIAGNRSPANGRPDLSISLPSNLTIEHSLIGDVDGSGLTPGILSDERDNFLGGGQAVGVIDPLLDPLGNNGGPTQTHSLQPTSLAVDGGRSTEIFDQRGQPFLRDDGFGPDIGAFELQASLPGDYNGDLVVSAADYVIFRDTVGSTTILAANGDDTGTSQGVIDQADYEVFASNFGAGVSPAAGPIAAASSASPLEQEGLPEAVFGALARQPLNTSDSIQASVGLKSVDTTEGDDDLLLFALAREIFRPEQELSKNSYSAREDETTNSENSEEVLAIAFEAIQ